MIDFKEKCTACSHHAICKYSDVYNSNYDKISKYINDLDEQFGDVCVVDVACKYFDSLHTPRKSV